MNPARIGTAAAALLTAFSTFGAHAAPNLDVYASGAIFDRGLPGNTSSTFIQTQDVSTGPLVANVEAGAVFTHACPGPFNPSCSMQTTVFARAAARADYGINAAAIKSGVRPANGTDLGTLPNGTLVDGIGAFGFGLPVETIAQSSWTDTFTVLGGTGLGTAYVSFALGGTASTGYGENGTVFYDAEAAFQEFGIRGYGFVHYNVRVRYEEDPIDFGSDGPPAVVGLDESFSPPLPAFVTEIGVPPDILTGSFVFNYGEPFSLESNLGLSGYHQIDIDYSHTAMLTLFDLPDGATLMSGSGFDYPTTLAIPEPETYALMLAGLGLLGFAARRRRSLTSTAIAFRG